jgi:(S)-2-hydroxyglutarate dehydrogenase
MVTKRFGIIGGGIVGLATAFKLRRALPDARIHVWEKESSLGAHQSTHNSGVLHAGLYYKPGSLKARLAVQGIREMVAFCAEHGVAHEICGKLVIAVDDSEIPRLRTLFERGQANGLRGLEWLSAERICDFEPHAAGVAAVRVPEEGIVDYRGVIHALSDRLAAQGVVVSTGTCVSRLQRKTDAWEVETNAGPESCDFLINCAGLHCDRVAALGGERRDVRIVPFRGEYYKLRADRTGLIRNLIYPVPDPNYPFLGVHFTRLIEGGIEAGPNAVLAFAREGYSKSNINARDLADALLYPGLWRFVSRHKAMCWNEVRRSFSRRLFCASLQRLVPDIREEDLVSGGVGVRAQAMTFHGDLVQDFNIIERPDAVHVINAPSPAATASLAIAEYIAAAVRRLAVA